MLVKIKIKSIHDTYFIYFWGGSQFDCLVCVTLYIFTGCSDFDDSYPFKLDPTSSFCDIRNNEYLIEYLFEYLIVLLFEYSITFTLLFYISFRWKFKPVLCLPEKTLIVRHFGYFATMWFHVQCAHINFEGQNYSNIKTCNRKRN